MIIPKNKLVAARWTNFSEKICIPIAFSRSIYGLAEHSYQDLKDLELIGYAHWCIKLVEEEMRFNAIKQLPYFRSMQTITKAVNECLFLIQATTTNVWRRNSWYDLLICNGLIGCNWAKGEFVSLCFIIYS
jgi:hypothetical protein